MAMIFSQRFGQINLTIKMKLSISHPGWLMQKSNRRQSHSIFSNGQHFSYQERMDKDAEIGARVARVDCNGKQVVRPRQFFGGMYLLKDLFTTWIVIDRVGMRQTSAITF